MNTATPPESPRTKRRWLRRGAWVVVTLAALVSAFAAYRYYTDHIAFLDSWREACAEADRLDPGWRWDDLVAARPKMLDDQNAAIRVETIAWRFSQSVSNSTPLLKTRKMDNEFRSTPPEHRLSPPIAEALHEALASAGPALNEALQLANCPEGRIAVPPSPVIASGGTDYFRYLRVAQNLLSPQVDLLAEIGDLDAALALLRPIINVSHPAADSFDLLGALMASSVRAIAAGKVERVLAQGEPSPAALNTAKLLLEREIARPVLLNYFRGARAELEDTIRALNDGRLEREVVSKSRLFWEGRDYTKQPTMNHWLNRATGADVRMTSAVARFRYLTWVIERLKESPDGLQDRNTEWAAMRDQLPAGMKSQMTNLSRYVPDVGVADAHLRCAVAALAAEQFRQAQGRWPTTLGELVPTYLTAVPRDPFVQSPLRLARLPDGIVIFSVGSDGKDDGGSIRGQPSGSPRDRGIRLWDVSQRRQPPLPPKADPSTKK